MENIYNKLNIKKATGFCWGQFLQVGEGGYHRPVPGMCPAEAVGKSAGHTVSLPCLASESSQSKERPEGQALAAEAAQWV